MRNQRGMSLSPFVAILLPALLVMIGLVVDGGAQAAAARRSELVAAAAARAAVDDTAAARLAGAQPNIAHAIAVAHNAIAAAGVTGDVQVVAGRVVVHTTDTVSTSLLSLIGITKLTASGSAEAELVADR